MSNVRTAPRLWHASPQVALLLVAAGGGWLWTVTRAQDMGAMPGTMGLGPAAFAVVWATMMTAMMLPSVAPTASLYARSVASSPLMRLSGFAAGYLLVWAASSLPAYGLAWLADRAVAGRPAAGTAAAVVIFAASGVYQLTPLKERCLARCRSPFALLLRYASWQGPFRELRAGAHHGAFCLGCCWSLMGLMMAFGVMNLWAMVGLATVVAVEKLWSRGQGFARAIGIASLGLAVAVIWFPWLARGLWPAAMAM